MIKYSTLGAAAILGTVAAWGQPAPGPSQSRLEDLRVSPAAGGWDISEKIASPARGAVPRSSAADATSAAVLGWVAEGREFPAPAVVDVQGNGRGGFSVRVSAPSVLAARAIAAAAPDPAFDLAALDAFQADYLNLFVRGSPAASAQSAQRFLVSFEKASRVVADKLLRSAAAGDYAQADATLQVKRRQRHEARAAAQANDFVLKSLYETDDVFRPLAYRRLLENLNRIGGIFLSDPAAANVTGVGILIAPTVMLTAAHNAALIGQAKQAGAAGNIRIVVIQDKLTFSYTYVRTILYSPDEVPPADPGYGDMALIEIAPVPVAGAPAPTPTFYSIQLGTAALMKPLYVLAYYKSDNHTLGIYDRAHTLFPFRVPSAEMSKVFGIAIDNLVGDEPSAVERQRIISRVREQFYRAYSFVPAEDRPDRVYAYRAIEVPLTAVSSRFAFDTDTIHGNSGGGIYAKETGELVGLFVGGAGDGSVPIKPSWDHKEQGVPAEAIRAFLRIYLDRRAAGTLAGPALELSP